MAEVVERVARAMCAAFGAEWGQGLLQPEDYRCLAVAAIAAMRDPTEAMHYAGQQEDLGGTEDVQVIYRAMIDAALK